ncbi:hypothetical protein BASA81_008109 [Batrachochytrium salamandrivorans]|nr:hypothetical protein BASA81_008109 [Batrachochytrium salamandrivorans]
MRLQGGHREPVTCLALCGGWGLSCGGRVAVVWCLETGELVASRTHPSKIEDCALFIEEGKCVAVTKTVEQEVLFWNLASGVVTSQTGFQFPPKTQPEVAFDQTCDEVALTWDANRTVVFTNQSYLTCARFLPSKRILCVGDRDGIIKRSLVPWCCTQGYSFDAHPFTFDSHSAQVNQLQLSWDGTYCLSCSDDTTLYYFDLFPQERHSLVLLYYWGLDIKPFLPLIKNMLM